MKVFIPLIVAFVLGAGGVSCTPSLAQSPFPLQIESKIPLGTVEGRIDHMAVDLQRSRLFVAELGNNSLGVVDLKDQKLVHRISGLTEPQGVVHVPSTDAVYVSNGGDGSVRVFRATDYQAAGHIELGDDADNVRLDIKDNRLWVGYGSGGLALIDPADQRKIRDIPLKAHPESFQLASSTGLIFVNVPKAQEIAVIDSAAGKQIASWPTDSRSNFPMVLDEQAGRVLVAFRNPARIGVVSIADSRAVASIEACGDADDLFLDGKRHRLYVSCGEGFLDVLDAGGNGYARLARIPTIAGARTSLFVPEMDRLFLAARAASGEGASIWVLRPVP